MNLDALTSSALRSFRQFDNQLIIIWQVGVIQGRLVAPHGPAALAGVDNDPTFFAAIVHGYRLERAPAVRSAVPRVDIDMQRVETVRTVAPVAAVR